MMKLLLFLFGLLTTSDAFAQVKPTRTRLFDKAEQPAYHDTQWRTPDLPHDWSIEDLPGQMPNQVTGPFSRASVGGTSTGYTVGGTGWYRKSLKLIPTEAGKTIGIQFDGAYMETDVWLNGHHLGYHPYGYTPLRWRGNYYPQGDGSWYTSD